MWIDKTAIFADFKVKVGSGGVPGGAGIANGLPLVDNLAAADSHSIQVSIHRVEGVQGRIVLDDHHDAISATHLTCLNHHTGVGSPYGISFIGTDIDPTMAIPVIIAGNERGNGWPYERACSPIHPGGDRALVANAAGCA